MKFRANLNLALLSGAFAAALAIVPGVSAAGGIDGAWDQFHNSHVSAGGSVPSSDNIVGAWDQFHNAHTASPQGSASPSFAGGSLDNPWDKFHQNHTSRVESDQSHG